MKHAIFPVFSLIATTVSSPLLNALHLLVAGFRFPRSPLIERCDPRLEMYSTAVSQFFIHPDPIASAR